MYDLSPDERLITAIIRKAFLEPGAVLPRDAASDDWSRLIDLAIKHRLAPLLYSSLTALGLRGSFSEESLERLTAVYMRSALDNMQKMTDIEVLQDVSAANGVPFVLLKGAAMARSLYWDPAVRPFNDIDILVHSEQRALAASLLLSLGYRMYLPSWGPGFEQSFDHGQHFQRQTGHTSTIDLHWHLLNPPYYQRSTDIDWFWSRTTIASPGSTLYTLSPEAAFLHLSAHLKLHHLTFDLLRTFDIALLLKRHRDSIAWNEVLSAAASFKLTAALRAACDEVRTYWGITPPIAVTSRLAALRLSKAEYFVFRAYTQPDAKLAPIFDFWFRPGLRAKLRYARAMVLPDESYLRLIQPPGARNASLLMLHARRLGRASHVILRSMMAWRARRGRNNELEGPGRSKVA